MAHTLGIITVGQAPRDDMADLFALHAPPGTKVVLRGALDGLSEAEIDAAKPVDGPDTLYTKLRGGRDVKLSKKAVIARSPETFAKLRADGCDVIVYACTGDFPPMDGDENVLFPSRVLNGLATGLLPRGRLGLLIPLAEQAEKLGAKWARPGLEVVAEALAPSAGRDEADAAARRLAAKARSRGDGLHELYARDQAMGEARPRRAGAARHHGNRPGPAGDARMKTQCCIVGGGPAGMMLGFLLARAGVEVIVLEKHGDFLRDFRGDTVHPSTMTVMDELGLLDEFLKLPHHTISRFAGQFGKTRVQIADLTHLPVPAPFIAMMPQWDFLDFLAAHGKAYPGFTLLMHAEAQGLIEEGGKVVGARTMVEGKPEEIRADLVVGADGRHSTVREAIGFKVETLGAPMDVLWFRLSHRPGDAGEVMGRFDAGSILVMLDRGDYWQCAYVIPKGSAETVRTEGIEKVRATIGRLMPAFADRLGELATMDDLKLLTVGVDRLEKWWRPGVLCIGDAAHAMSPIGGVGINLAIQDAVAAANILAAPLREGRLTDADLAAVEARRLFPARATQAAQVFLQNRIIAPSLAAAGGKIKVPFVVRLMQWLPILRRLPARLVGMGVRPEHGSDEA